MLTKFPTTQILQIYVKHGIHSSHFLLPNCSHHKVQNATLMLASDDRGNRSTSIKLGAYFKRYKISDGYKYIWIFIYATHSWAGTFDTLFKYILVPDTIVLYCYSIQHYQQILHDDIDVAYYNRLLPASKLGTFFYHFN